MQTGKSGEKSSFAPEKTGVCRCEGKAVHSSGRWPLALELALSTRVLSKKADFFSAQQKALEIEIWRPSHANSLPNTGHQNATTKSRKVACIFYFFILPLLPPPV